jgi:hypothetical protein
VEKWVKWKVGFGRFFTKEDEDFVGDSRDLSISFLGRESILFFIR